MGGLLTLIGLGLTAFFIYFVFKQIQFFIQSVDLYKKMVDNQQTIIQLLKNINMKE